MNVSLASHSRTADDCAEKIGSRVRNASKKLGLIVVEAAAIAEHSQSEHNATLESTEELLTETTKWSEANVAVAKDIEAMVSLCEVVSLEASVFSEAHGKAVTELGSLCKADGVSIDLLEAAVQEMTAAAVGASEKSCKQIGDASIAVVQFHDLAEKQATDWAAGGQALERTVQGVLDVNAKLSEADVRRLEKLLASGTTVASLVDEFHAQNGNIANDFTELQERQSLSKSKTAETAERWGVQVADALQAEVEQAQKLIDAAPNETASLEELERAVTDQVAASTGT